MVELTSCYKFSVRWSDLRIVNWKNGSKCKEKNCLNLNGFGNWFMKNILFKYWLLTDDELNWNRYCDNRLVELWITGSLLFVMESNSKTFSFLFLWNRMENFVKRIPHKLLHKWNSHWNFFFMEFSVFIFFNKLHNMDMDIGHNAIWLDLLEKKISLVKFFRSDKYMLSIEQIQSNSTKHTTFKIKI